MTKYIAVITTGIFVLLAAIAFDIRIEGGYWPHERVDLTAAGVDQCRAELLVESKWEERNDKNREWFEKNYKELLQIDPYAKVDIYKPLTLPEFTQVVRMNCIHQHPEWAYTWTAWEMPKVVFGER